MAKGFNVRNLGELTREIVSCPSFKLVEDEVLSRMSKNIERGLNVKLDKIFK